MPLRIHDTQVGESNTIFRTLEDQRRGEIGVEFDVTPAAELGGDLEMVRFSSPENLSFTSLILGEENTFKLRTWHYPTYPSLSTFVPFYPSDENVLPGTQEVFSSSLGTFRVQMIVFNAHTQSAEVTLYVEKLGGRAEDAFAGNLNWWFGNVGKIELGCVSAETPYDLTFDNILMSGDVPDPNWYSIKNYQGFKLQASDKDKLWIGANDINDPLTHSERTTLKHLARYDYARVIPEDMLDGTPKGLRWYLP